MDDDGTEVKEIVKMTKSVALFGMVAFRHMFTDTFMNIVCLGDNNGSMCNIEKQR